MTNIRFTGTAEIFCKLKANLGWSKSITTHPERSVLKVLSFHTHRQKY